MSSFYRALPRLIPQLLLLARQGSEVFLISPWVDDIALNPPLLARGENYSARSEIHLSELLLELARDYKIHVTFIVRERDYRFERATGILARTLPKQLTVHLVPYLHAKAVVTESFVLETSANLISTSLYRNVETCSVLANPYSSPREWVKVKLGLII